MVEDAQLAFTKKIKGICTMVSKTTQIKALDFLTEDEQDVLGKMVDKDEAISVKFAGGFEGSERRRATVFPSFMDADAISVAVSVFEVETIGNEAVTHAQLLGSLMGLSIDRSVIGDVVIEDGRAFFACCSAFDLFLKEHLIQVGRVGVRLDYAALPVVRNQQFETVEVIVSSLRMDVIVKAIVQASRTQVEAKLEAGWVRLNHNVDKKGARTCRIGDVLSVRKHGRFKLSEVKKTTKSGKLVLVMKKSV